MLQNQRLVPVLLNTSFNVRGDPIVETPLDAGDCFVLTELDALVIHDLLVEKRWTYRFVRPLTTFVTRTRRNLRSEAWMQWFARQYLSG